MLSILNKVTLVILLFLTPIALGQSFTNVTATLTDSGGQVWSNAIITVSLRPAPNNPGVPLNTGLPITDTPQTVVADATGTFTVTVDDTSKINPSGSMWTFTMCPNATVSTCTNANLTVTGVSQNLSSSLSSFLTPPKVFAQPFIFRAYSDSEAIGGTGALYWNTTTNVIKGCIGTPCTWNTIGGGGGVTGQYVVINVQTFGAVGDGIVDDTASITNAINACPQASPTIGCIVFFPLGIYKTTSNINIALLKSVYLLGPGAVGTGGSAAKIQTNGAYFAFTVGNGVTPNSNGFQVDSLGFIDNTGNGLGAFQILASRDGEISNVVCLNYLVGACIELDGGSNFTQFFTLRNIYSWKTKFRIQTNNKTASVYVIGGEGNCQNSGATDVIANSIDIDLGFTNHSAGTGTASEWMVETQAQNCQTGIALWNAGGNRFFGKAVEETINARPSNSVGVLVDGDTPSLANGNYFDGIQVTKAGTAFWLKANATNTTIITPIFNGTNGNDLIIDQTALASTRVIANKRFTGWTTNISDVARSGNVVTAHTTANSDNGNLTVQIGSLITLFNVIGGATNFNGTFSLVSVTPNISTGITTLTWNQTGGNESGTINAGACGTVGSCIAALSTVTSGGVGVIEYVGDQQTQHVVMQVPNIPNQENLYPGCLASTNNIFFDGSFTDICENNVGLLHLSNGPAVNFNGSTAQSYTPQPTTYVGGNGTVNTNGTAVTWVSGNLFNQSWVGANIVINNAIFLISAVNNNLTALTIGSTAGVQNGVNYNTSGLVGVVACTNPSSNVCKSSDDKGFLFANNTNGTTACLPIPGKANGYPPGFTWTVGYNAGSGANALSVTLPGQTSFYGIACPGGAGTTLDGLTTVRNLTNQQGLVLWTDGSNWKSVSGSPSIPVDQLAAALTTNPVNIIAGNFTGGGAGANNGGTVNVVGGNSNSTGGTGGNVVIGPGQDSASGTSGQLQIYQTFTSGSSTTGKEHNIARNCVAYDNADCSNTSPANLGNSVRISITDTGDTGNPTKPIGIIISGSAIGQPAQIQTSGKNTVKVENNCTVGQYIEVSQQVGSTNGLGDCTNTDTALRVGYYIGPAGAAGCSTAAPCTVPIFISPAGNAGQLIQSGLNTSCGAGCTIIYPTPYPIAPNVLLTGVNGSVNIVTGSVTTTQFQVNSTVTNVYWMAIGLP